MPPREDGFKDFELAIEPLPGIDDKVISEILTGAREQMTIEGFEITERQPGVLRITGTRDPRAEAEFIKTMQGMQALIGNVTILE